MSGTAALVTLAFVVFTVLPVAGVVIAQRRHTRQLLESGRDPHRIALDLQRKGYARGLVPVVEDLMDRVEALEAEVDRLTASQRDA